MANSLPYTAPSLVGQPGIDFYNKAQATPNFGAVWRRGDILLQQTTGTITNPNPNGSIAAVVPTAVPTVGSTSSSGAPAQFLYYFYTYIGAGSIESQPSKTYPLNVAPGTEATITVPSAGAPAAAVDFALYVGNNFPGQEAQQVASTALGSAATIPYPLTNTSGINRAATNTGSSIVGIAWDDFDVTYAPTAVFSAGFTNRSLFGIDQTAPPVGFPEQYSGYYTKASGTGNGLVFEINLVQAWYSSLLNSTAGLLYSTTYDTFAADNSQSNKVLTIIGKVNGSQNPNYGDTAGTIGDTGARVIVRFNSGYLA